MTNVQSASADTNASQDTKNAATNPKTRIICGSCNGLGSKWNGFINERCWPCNGKGYLEV